MDSEKRDTILAAMFDYLSEKLPTEKQCLKTLEDEVEIVARTEMFSDDVTRRLETIVDKERQVVNRHARLKAELERRLAQNQQLAGAR